MSAPSRCSDPIAVLTQGLSDLLQRTPKAEELEQFQRYLDLLIQWNTVHRLTAYRHQGEIVQKLLLDSLLFLKVLPPSALQVLDYGAGAGIPGIPLKIVLPQIILTLVEARRNRVSFLMAVLRELGFQGVTILHGRGEQLLEERQAIRAAFDAVVVRAVGPLSGIVSTALSFLKPGGVVIASGPPASGKTPTLPGDIRASWKFVTSRWSPSPRRFLLVEKED